MAIRKASTPKAHFQIHDRVSSVAVGKRAPFIGVVTQITLSGKNSIYYHVLDYCAEVFQRDHEELTLVLEA